jgi:hypothetical protein
MKTFVIALILSIVVFVITEAIYPSKATDMFSGSGIIALFAFPFIWFLAFQVSNALQWRQEMLEERVEMASGALRGLVKLGAERGFLYLAEIKAALPDDISDPGQIDGIVSMFRDLNIEVRDD